MPREELKEIKRLVVKVGTSTLTHENGEINLQRMERLVRTLSDIQNQEIEVVLVSSGAIQFGIKKLKLQEKPKSIRIKQAVSAVGQCELMQLYSRLFSEYGHTVGQVLLTKDVIEDEHVCNNVINTFKSLFELGVCPIVNENDTVAIDEIENIVRFGDNDQLSAIVASLISADLLVILSDVDGFYDRDPTVNPDSKLIKKITQITSEFETFAGVSHTSLGTGGMVTKLQAGKIANEKGVHLILANGKNPSILFDILEGKDVGTFFVGKENKSCPM